MRLIDGDALKREITKYHAGLKPRYISKLVDAEIDDIQDIIDEAPTVDTESVITGETSDGYHTFNELYHHRAVLFSVIVKAFKDKAWKSRKHHDGTMYDGMFIVGVETPYGQATYHYDMEPYWEMFCCKEIERAPEWDGHTPAQAIERIGKLEPIRHGRWETKVYTTGDGLDDWGVINHREEVCSECGKWQIGISNFCPNCGAKMDEGEQNVAN